MKASKHYMPDVKSITVTDHNIKLTTQQGKLT